MEKAANQTTDTPTKGIEPEFVDGHYQLVATNAFEAGDHILRLEGEIYKQPSRFSVQVGPGQHIDLPAEAQAEQPMDRYLWRFLNHSCEPNSEFHDQNLRAIRKIKPSEQITFNYNTNEDLLATPFECQCGSDQCCGVVRGRNWQGDQAKG